MKALIKSFAYAFSGLRYCLKHERNMRIHLVCSLYMYSYLLLFDFFVLSRAELALIFIANALVFMGELINTAIETTINLVESKYNRLAKIAKDTAAAAVLAGAFFAVLTGVVLLWQPEAFRALFEYYKNKPQMIAALLVSFAACGAYIFAGPRSSGKQEKER